MKITYKTGDIVRFKNTINHPILPNKYILKNTTSKVVAYGFPRVTVTIGELNISVSMDILELVNNNPYADYV